MTTKTPLTLTILSLIGLILTCLMTSCSSTQSIAHTPSKREIRKAMSYSTSEYAMPGVYSNTGTVGQSKYCFHYKK